MRAQGIDSKPYTLADVSASDKDNTTRHTPEVRAIGYRFFNDINDDNGTNKSLLDNQ